MKKFKNITEDRGKFRLQLRIQGYQTTVGRFDTLDEALLVRALAYQVLQVEDPDQIPAGEDDFFRYEELMSRIDDARYRTPLSQTEAAPRAKRRTKSELELTARVDQLTQRLEALEQRLNEVTDAFERYTLDHAAV